MGFDHRRPAPPLDLLVEKLWDWDMPPAAHRYERLLPTPGSALVINLHEDETRVYSDDAARRCTRASGSVVGGPSLSSQIIDTAEQVRVMGVVFRPGGLHAFTGDDIGAWPGRDIDLPDVFGSRAAQLRERLLETGAPQRRLDLLESWLRRRLRVPRLAPAVEHALDALGRAPQVARVAAVARDAGISERGLGRLFRQQVGFSPKRYARLMRFRAVVAQARTGARIAWGGIAADSGYCDQAHLVHEFRRFAGMTPGEFMARRGPYPNHLPLD
ncbi:AraC family transcriptional regulator [Frateuria sp. Soil773]|uniref:AraC family transcriptional regulator n=1 Tax=Frateuria sp. Soil773 TaxID=1736407 RepID=UPI0006FC0FAB|nr:helix-turn-helix domain-containing protein [Frateuria sp. Soil773]KRE89341.1 AraC family transcriptional regulator [Frateuria sp. Soil773]